MFEGFPVAALDFYDDLELDNTRSFWAAHKQVYDDAVRAPMTALCAALEPEFGSAKLFRPYRDVRFARDKTPYKTSQGAYVASGPGTGWYVEVAAPGVSVGAGFFHAETDRLALIREAIDDDRSGARLQRLLRKMERDGFEVGGERLKTSPRGYDAGHPRIDLLRHKQIIVSRSYGFEPVVHTADLLDRVRQDWQALRPLVRWVQDAAD